MSKKLIGMEAIRRAAAPKAVELPGWEPGESWTAKLRRPGLYELVGKGAVPNPLLGEVERLFMGAAGSHTSKDEVDALMVIAKAALVEPTLDELTEAGAALTDDQLLCIYSFVLGGALGLSIFRKGTGRTAAHDEPQVADGACAADADHGSADGVVPE